MDQKPEEYRIFISYRSKSDGVEFADVLYKHMKNEPFSDKLFGNIYYSPMVKVFGNYKNDIPEIMENIEYFVVPLTGNFFAGFIDRVGDSQSEFVITFRELLEALKKKRANKASIHFICITFPDYHSDTVLLRKLFQEDADFILCAKTIPYDIENPVNTFRQIADQCVRRNLDFSAYEIIKKAPFSSPNVFLSFKGDTEDTGKYPLFEKFHDVERITLLNYASTTFVSGVEVAGVYEKLDMLKRFFMRRLQDGSISVDMILTDPHSPAAQDAADYKMFPKDLDIPKEQIIIHNLNTLFQFKRENPNARIEIHLTQIALPYGVMSTQHKNRHNNHMKIDIYAARPSDDTRRPSFYLLQDDEATSALYSSFLSNIYRIKDNSFDFSNGRPDFSWLYSKEIIHQGLLDSKLVPHTKGAYEACIEHRYPIEVDLLRLSDGVIIVCRNDHDIKKYGFSEKLSECNRTKLSQINKKAPKDERILRLEEFCDLISDHIPVLFEIKVDSNDSEEEIKAYVADVVMKLRLNFRRSLVRVGGKIKRYIQRFAIHSSSPIAIQCVKKLDCMIPCGIISTDFSQYEGLSSDFVEIHRTAKFMEIARPDFLCYDIRYMENGIGRRECDKAGIPLFAWTIKSQEDEYAATSVYECDGMIIEGRPTFIN